MHSEMYLYSFPVWGSIFAMHLFESKRPTDDQIERHKITKGLQKTGRTDRRMDKHIIMPLRVFEPVACGRMQCMLLQAEQMNFYS